MMTGSCRLKMSLNSFTTRCFLVESVGLEAEVAIFIGHRLNGAQVQPGLKYSIILTTMAGRRKVGPLPSAPFDPFKLENISILVVLIPALLNLIKGVNKLRLILLLTLPI